MKKAKKKAVESNSESGSDSESESDSELTHKKHHHANRMQVKTLRCLKATLSNVCSCHGKTTMDNLFIAHPDSGVSNHMTDKLDLFDPTSFEKLSSPIAISLGDDSEIFATGKGTIHLMFNINGEQKQGKFTNILYVPELKVTLLSVGQSAQLPHCKVVFDSNICDYIDKTTDKVIA